IGINGRPYIVEHLDHLGIMRRRLAESAQEICELAIGVVAFILECSALLAKPLCTLDDISGSLDADAEHRAELRELLARQDHVALAPHLHPRLVKFTHELDR